MLKSSKLKRAPRRDSHEWALYDVEELAEILNVDLETGLSDAQAARLLSVNGPNVLPTGSSKWKKVKFFFRQFTEITHIVIFTMGVIHIVLGIPVGGGLLIFLSVINFSVTYSQEVGFEGLMKKLRSTAATQALIVRDKVTKKIESKNLVVGDIVLLQSGDTIPADLRIVQSSELKCTEAVFTGESVDVRKTSSKLTEECKSLQDRRNMAFMSTSVVSGHGKGIVVATGKDTQLAKISESLTSVDDKIFTHTDQLLLKMYGFFLILAIAVALLIMGLDGFHLSVSVTEYAMAAIMSVLPSGLRTVLLVLLTASSRRLLKCNVVLKRLQVLELSGYAKMMFCDKTGTLTIATMTAVVLWTPDGGYITTTGRGIIPRGSLRRMDSLSNIRECLTSADDEEQHSNTIGNFELLSDNEKFVIITSSLCNNSFIEPSFSGKGTQSLTWKGFGSPTELSLCVLAHKIKAQKPNLEFLGWKIVKEIPFDCNKKIMSVVVLSPDKKYYILTKGATEKVLEFTHPAGSADEDTSVILDHVNPLTDMTLRALAFSYKAISNEDAALIIDEGPIPNELLYSNAKFAGIVGIYDPIRPGVPQTITQLRDAGISVRLLTGDSKGTAIEIAKEAGIIGAETSQNDLDKLVRSGTELQKLTDEDLAATEIPYVVYRCTPELKLRVVTKMKYPGYKSIVVGDGLNDAASIKAADVGISMGLVSTNITRAAADIVLINDDFTKIIDFLREGRCICWKLKYFLMYYWITLISTLLSCLVAINNRASDTETWVVIITGSTIMFSYIVCSLGCAWFFDTRFPSDIMKYPPRSQKDKTFTPEVTLDIVYHSLLMMACSVSPFFIVVYTSEFRNFIGDCDVNNLSPGCERQYRGRTASFLTFTFLLLVEAVHCRSIRMTEWNMLGIKRTLNNWFVLVSSLAILTFCCCMAYIKSAGNLVLYQTSITWETALVPIFIVIDILGVEFYKYAKRRIYGTLSDEVSVTRE